MAVEREFIPAPTPLPARSLFGIEWLVNADVVEITPRWQVSPCASTSKDREVYQQ